MHIHLGTEGDTDLILMEMQLQMVGIIYPFLPIALDLASVRQKYVIHNPHRGLPMHNTIIYQTN